MVLLGCGALNVDYLFAAESLVTDGETFCNPVGRQPGGSAANTVFTLARLGMPCRFAGVVGDDPDGKLVLESLVAAGVDTDAVVVRRGQGTGRVFCFVDRQGHRALYVCPDANLTVTAAELERAFTLQVSWVHCSSFAGDVPFAAQRSFVAGLPPGIRLSLAPGALYAARGLTELRLFLKRCAVVFLTATELKTLTGIPEPLGGARRLLREGVHTVAVTLGREGSLVVTAESQHRQLALAVDAVDTTGAGDAFAAGFLFGRLKGWAVDDAQRFATVVASFAVENWGARSGAPDLAQARARYEKAYGAPFPETR
jgi:ribokinase